MKEMVGGCCVCSDDRGWTENPLVYCDGAGCTVAVHQACYGIVTVPSGPWFCRKCESQERAARVRCELCPSKDGALKRTDNTGWAHVVCALYIPEVRFGNVSTMEPIILSMVPPERFNKSCYICENQERESKSKIGACMNCNKQGCKLHFHVTCAQAMGLLCEEAGNYMDNVKYCGYCQHHYSKLKKGANLKTIPAFKPLPPVGSSTDPSFSEKSLPISSGSTWTGQPTSVTSNCNGSKEKQRKKPGRKSSTQVSPKASNSRDSASSSVIVEGPGTSDDSKMKTSKSEVIPFANVLAGVGLVPGPRVSMTDQNNSGLEKHESSEIAKQENARTSDNTNSGGSKKHDKYNDSSKLSSSIVSGTVSTPAETPSMNIKVDKSRASRRKISTRSTSPTSQGGNDTESTLSSVSDQGPASSVEQFITASEHCAKGPTSVKVESPTISESHSSALHSVIVSSATATQPESTQVQSSQSVPQRAVSPLVISACSGSSSQISSEQAKLHYDDIYQNTVKELSRPIPSATPAKKPRRGRTPKVSAPVVPESPPSSPDSAGVEQQPKRRKKATKSVPAGVHNDDQHNLPTAINRAEIFQPSHVHQPASQTTESALRRESPCVNQMARENVNVSKAPEHVVLPTFPIAPTLPVGNAGTKDLSPYKEIAGSSIGKENSLYLRNGITAPHMLGNQLNLNSSVAQKMTDTLVAEVEAHSVTDQPSPIGKSTNFVGVPFPFRTVSPSLKPSTQSGSSAPAFPHSLGELLERQWEQGSQFLMEQAQHFDIASLLSCLHNLKEENMRLEDHVANLNRRRDHLLAVNARLSVPLQSNQMTYASNVGTTPDRSTPGSGHAGGHGLRYSPQDRERNSRATPYLPQMDNGIGISEHLPASMGNAFSTTLSNHRSPASSSHLSDRVIPSPVIVSSRMNHVYHPVPSGGAISLPSTMSPVQGSSCFMSEGRNLTVLRSPSSTPEMRPEVARSTPSQQHPSYPYVSPPLSVPPHHPGSYAGIAMTASNSQNHHSTNARRDGSDSRHPISRPSPIERR